MATANMERQIILQTIGGQALGEIAAAAYDAEL